MLYQIPLHLSFALQGKTKRKTKKDQTKVKPQIKRKVWIRNTFFNGSQQCTKVRKMENGGMIPR